MKKIAIIGGGLAGTACAYVLKSAGLQPVIYEASNSLASGASGNDAGMYNPRLAAEHTPESAYFMSAFDHARQVFAALDDIDWNPCGALHLITDQKRQTRYHKMVENWDWTENDLRIVSASQASEISGVDIKYDALYLSQSGSVSPKKLCDALSKDIEVQFNRKLKSLQQIDADAIIIASAMGSQSFEETAWLGLKSVRGQITYTEPSEYSQKLKAALCYGGYCAPVMNGRHIVGSSFQRWLDHTDIIEQDDHDNLSRLNEFVPTFSDGMKIVDRRASLRTTSKDHFPVVGALPHRKNIYLSTAHGSHGIISSIESAYLLRDIIMQRKPSLTEATIERLSPARYYGAG